MPENSNGKRGSSSPRREDNQSPVITGTKSPSGERLVIAAIQMTSGNDIGPNTDAAISLLREAGRRGAAMAGLPECFSFMGKEADRPRIAEDVDGPTIGKIRETARELRMTVLAGSISERYSADPGRVFNTSVLIDDEGEISAVYRKIHLFDVELEDARALRESKFTMAGDDVVTGEAGGIRHGLTICYDLRFPELYRRLDEEGSELIWVPSAFTLATGKDHWEVLVRARAIENGTYVAAPAQFGRHSPKRSTYGNAMIVDPWGKVLARAPDRANTMAVAEIDLSYRDEVRQAMPTWRHHVL